MANAWYPEYKEFLLSAAANVSLTVNDATDGPFCALIDTGTAPYLSTHTFYNMGTGADFESGKVGTDQRITSPTVADGTFDGGDLTYTSVSGATVEALGIYRHNSGADTTWKVVLFLDTSITGLPVTPNGGNITVTFNASGIATISERLWKKNVAYLASVGPANLYAFNYLWDDATHIGMMADEVEEFAPEAVVRGNDGWRRVNYGMALERVWQCRDQYGASVLAGGVS